MPVCLSSKLRGSVMYRVKGSEFIVDNTKVGYETCAYMGLFLAAIHQRIQKLTNLGVINLPDSFHR